MRVLGIDIHGQSLDWVRGVTGVLLLLLSWLDSLPVAVELGVVDLLPSKRETSSRTTSRISFLHKVRLVRRHLWLGKSRKIMSYYVNIISMRAHGFKLLFAVSQNRDHSRNPTYVGTFEIFVPLILLPVLWPPCWKQPKHQKLIWRNLYFMTLNDYIVIILRRIPLKFSGFAKER